MISAGSLIWMWRRRNRSEDAIKKILAENGRLDVVVHNAGHMVFGPAEVRSHQSSLPNSTTV